MNRLSIKRTSPRARTAHDDCSGRECAAGARNNYFIGKHLTPESYRMEQVYGIDRRRLLNRAVHGWGVVYGFALAIDDAGGPRSELLVGEGLALDAWGRELIQPQPVQLSLSNLLVLGRDGKPVRNDEGLNQRFDDAGCTDDDCWLLTAHYAEKTFGRSLVADPCRCEREEWDRICETLVYSLARIDCADCCVSSECEVDCSCPPDAGCCAKRREQVQEADERIRAFTDRYKDEIAALEREDAATAGTRHNQLEEELGHLVDSRNALEAGRNGVGGCSCLCEHLTEVAPGGDTVRMTDVDDCTHADLANGVALACLKLARDKCGTWSIQSVEDDCGPRRLVKRNDLLFDLIDGCHVTTIVETGWARWHRRSTPPVPFEAFQDALGWTGDRDDGEYATRDFWVRFSRQVRADTLKPDAFVMAAMSDHGDDFWRSYVRVPIMSVETDSDARGLARTAKLVVGTDWLRDAVGDRDHLFAQGRVRIEIEVRGDLITDCLGQQIDANARGRSPAPTGNGAPGGTYISGFTVASRVARDRRAAQPQRQQPAAQAAAGDRRPDNRNR